MNISSFIQFYPILGSVFCFAGENQPAKRNNTEFICLLKKKPETNKKQQTGVKFFKRNFVLGIVLELTAFIVNENKRKEG